MLVRLLAVSLMSLGTALAVAPVAAQAGPPPPCFTEHDLLKVGNSVRAYSYRSCADEPPAPLGVSLQRRDPATGNWNTVAQGIGEAQFNCFGTGLRTFRHAKAPSLTLKANCT